jgi:hypothetical protein
MQFQHIPMTFNFGLTDDSSYWLKKAEKIKSQLAKDDVVQGGWWCNF